MNECMYKTYTYRDEAETEAVSHKKKRTLTEETKQEQDEGLTMVLVFI